MAKHPLKNKAFFELYGAQHYTNTRCLTVEEFQKDLKLFSDVKRLLRQYIVSGEIEERLILNNLITIYNVFTAAAAVEILRVRLEEKLHSALWPFLIYLNMIDEKNASTVPLDKHVVDKLRAI